jgi:predicted transposase YdaD
MSGNSIEAVRVSKSTADQTDDANAVASPHDHLFKRMLEVPQTARMFLEKFLPAPFARLMSDRAPTLIPGSYVRSDLVARYTDLLFHVPLTTGKDLLTLVLVEHKSLPDRWARLQTAKYMVDILSNWQQDSKNPSKRHLPILAPMIFHHGAKWGIDTEFAALFGKLHDQGMQPYLLSFRHALVDLATMPESELSDDPRLRAFLRPLQLSRTPILVDGLEVLLADTS